MENNIHIIVYLTCGDFTLILKREIDTTRTLNDDIYDVVSFNV